MKKLFKTILKVKNVIVVVPHYIKYPNKNLDNLKNIKNYLIRYFFHVEHGFKRKS